MRIMGERARHRSLLRKYAKLEAINEALRLRVDRVERERERAKKERDGYKDLYKALLRRLFGRRSEQISPDQLQLEFGRLAEEGLEAAASDLAEQTSAGPAGDEQEPSAPRSRHRGRRPLPADLPRRRKRYELAPEERACKCCAAEMVEIGQDVTEELEYEPASFYITELVRVKYACRACDQGIARTPMPDRPIEKGRPGPGLLAHIAVAKYGDHLPLYRLEAIFERAGVEIARQTMCEWIAQLAELLAPVVAELKRQLLTDPLLQSDDTVVPYQGDQKGRVSKGYLWAYTRPYAEVVFDFTTNHSRAGPIEFLGDFEGYLQTDGHSSYNGVYATGKIVHVGCMAHVRRKFFEARAQAPEDADLVLAAIQSLYRIERQAATAGLVGANLVALRQSEARPVVTSLGNWLEAMAASYRPKSPMAKAIGYARGQWPAVTRYVDVAEARADNNSSEQAIKPIVIGRKNWMFAGSAEGGHRAATLYSLIVSCKRLGIDPYAYLRDVIEVVASHPNKRIGELTPRAWAAAHATSFQPSDVAVA
jgi:transposase